MHINSIQSYKNDNQTNFKGIAIIKISKQAFKNPDNIISVNREASPWFNAMSNINSNLFVKVLSLFGYNKKSVHYLETPLYVKMQKELNKMGGDRFNYNMDWLCLSADVSKVKPLDDSCHSFFVFTKEHLSVAKDILSSKTKKETMRQLMSTISCNETLATRYNGNPALPYAEQNAVLRKIFDLNFEGEPMKSYRIEQLPELKTVFERIEP